MMIIPFLIFSLYGSQMRNHTMNTINYLIFLFKQAEKTSQFT